MFAIAQNTVNHYFLLRVIFELFGIRISFKKHLLCSLGISLVYLVPLYLVDCFFFAPGIYFSVWLYTMLIFINPLSAVVEYFVIKKTLKLSPTKSSIILRNHLLMHYCVVLIYLMQNNVLYSVLPSFQVFPHFYFHEIVSIMLIIALLATAYLLFRFYMTKRKRYISIPLNYFDNNIPVQFLQTFAVLSAFYGVIVFFRIEWLSGYLDLLDPTVIFIYLLLIACVFLYIIISIFGFRAKLSEWEIRASGTYISSLLNVNQEFRGIKHDFYNVLQTYEGYLEIEDIEGLKKYHRTLFAQTKITGDFLSIIETLKSRVAVYSLLRSKSETAGKAGISFSINMVCDIRNIVLNDLDLCRVLSIVIDNANEAAAESERKQINISFEQKDERTIIFVISNTTKDHVAIDEIFHNGYTTKKNHSGIGLPQVAHIMHSYEHCGYRVNYHDNQFTLFLIFYAGEE